MEVRKIGDNIIEIDGKVRIEPGPARRTEVATGELLSDHFTAPHYAVGMPDAVGNVIALGQPMTFIDYRAPTSVFYVYRLEEVDDEVNGKPVTVSRWMPQGSHAEEAAALSQATTLAIG